MKYVIASDIHGSYYYAKKIIDAFNSEKADKILLLGDILYHGPRNPLPKEHNPQKVYELLNEYKHAILCVRGNCDAEVDQMVLDFNIMADYLIINHKNNVIFATHGHIYNENALPYLQKGDVLLHGHTHLTVCDKHENYTYINPGSIALPKDDNHGYIVYENGVFTFKNESGEVIKTYEM
jgi:putative phosphoesterase